MKSTVRVFLCIGLWAISHSVFAQDTIVFKTGEELKAIVQEVGIETVKYKKYTNADGPVYTVPKSDVFMLKYQSGGKDVFPPDGEPQSVENGQAQQSEMQEELSVIRDKLNRNANRGAQRSAVNASNDAESQNSDYQLSDDCALLHFYRPGGLVGVAISYDLHLDDEVVFRVKNKSKTTIRVTEEGLKTLWAKTEARVELPIDIQLGQEYYIRCGVEMGVVVGRPFMEIVNNNVGKAQYDKIAVKVKK